MTIHRRIRAWRLSQETKQTTISHDGLPNGATLRREGFPTRIIRPERAETSSAGVREPPVRIAPQSEKA